MDGWIVTLVCGASGVGKSRLAMALAHRYGVPLAEADDITTALAALTTAAQHPMLHYWAAHPEAGSWPPERIATLHLAVADSVRAGYAAVIADHVESAAKVVLEGDYLLPELANGSGGAVRAVVVEELDEDRLVANYLAREPEHGEQRGRARVSLAVSTLLAERANAAGVPLVPAWPWADQLDRVDRALRDSARG